MGRHPICCGSLTPRSRRRRVSSFSRQTFVEQVAEVLGVFVREVLGRQVFERAPGIAAAPRAKGWANALLYARPLCHLLFGDVAFVEND